MLQCKVYVERWSVGYLVCWRRFGWCAHSNLLPQESSTASWCTSVRSPGHWEKWARPLWRINLYRKGKVKITFSMMCVGSALDCRPSLVCACLLCMTFPCILPQQVRLHPGVLCAHFQHVCIGRWGRVLLYGWGPCCGTAWRAELKSLLKHCKLCVQHNSVSPGFPCLLSATLGFSTSWKDIKEI